MYVTQAYKTQMVGMAIISQILGTPENFDIAIGVGSKITNVNNLQPLEKVPLDIKILLGEPFLERTFLSYISTQADLKRNTFGLTPVQNQQLFAATPVWREREIVREIEVVYCRYCGTKNNARQMNCSKCSATL